MVPEALAIVLPILTVVGAFVLVGFKGWANHQLRMRETPSDDNERLTEAVERLQDDVAELQERVDFTERVLSEVKTKNVIGSGD